MGKHIINGPVAFGEDSQILFKPEGVFETGDCTWFHRNILIICYKYIKVDDGNCVTWEDQIIDTKFHYMIRDSVITNNLLSEVIIGKNVWIGNRTTIMRGAYVPCKSIVASNSLMNKKFSEYIEYVLIAVSPGKIVRTNIKRAQYKGVGSSGSIFSADAEIRSFFKQENLQEINVTDKSFKEYLNSSLE